MEAKRTSKVTAVIGICIVLNCAAADQDRLFDDAESAARDGRLMDMQTAFERVLQQDPTNVQALNGIAAAQAWQGDFAAAQESYSRSLDLEPQNVATLNGLGYAYAWAGAFADAHDAFQRALFIDPMNGDARKGIAYSYHWSGEHDLALSELEIANSVAPDDAEIVEATGHVVLSLGRNRDAIALFDRALEIDPSRGGARIGRHNAHSMAPMLEVSAVLGSTSGLGSGLRAAEIAYSPDRSTRVAVRFDDSLTFDNSSLHARGEQADAYYVSLLRAIGQKGRAGIEFGQRQFDTNTEDVLTLQGGYSDHRNDYRLGVHVGRQENGADSQLLFAGVTRTLTERWKVGPTIFLSKVDGTKDKEWRMIVDAEYLPPAGYWGLGAFVGIGNVTATDPLFDGDIVTAGLKARYQIADSLLLQFSVRQEDMPSDDLTVAEIGLTYRLAGN